MAKLDLNKITIEINKELANAAWNAALAELTAYNQIGDKHKSKSFDEWWVENAEQSTSNCNKHIVINWVATSDRLPEKDCYILIYNYDEVTPWWYNLECIPYEVGEEIESKYWAEIEPPCL